MDAPAQIRWGRTPFWAWPKSTGEAGQCGPGPGVLLTEPLVPGLLTPPLGEGPAPPGCAEPLEFWLLALSISAWAPVRGAAPPLPIVSQAPSASVSAAAEAARVAVLRMDMRKPRAADGSVPSARE